MFGAHIALPFLAAMIGALFATLLDGPNALEMGAAIGFGVGCAILALVWLVFAILRRMVE